MNYSKELTTEPVRPGDTTGMTPEFGRIRDVEKTTGLKRGSVYNLLALGHIKGCVLRVRGNKSGIRLIDMGSVRNYIRAQMDEQNGPAGCGTGFKSLEAAQAPASVTTTAEACNQ
ncbi:MAG TPA: hypothetical protein VN578_22585 [Candidatus Binatia bacterium]|jgi:hypothetical protein|nr:hypothetical protein [Candidatus Binatia bacterium]